MREEGRVAGFGYSLTDWKTLRCGGRGLLNFLEGFWILFSFKKVSNRNDSDKI
jgi:hypothetical protein